MLAKVATSSFTSIISPLARRSEIGASGLLVRNSLASRQRIIRRRESSGDNGWGFACSITQQ